MKLKELLLVVHLLVGFHFILHAQNHLVVYPAPDEVDLKKDFTVKVREVGKEWQWVDVYPMKVDEVRQTKHHVELASMGYFDFSGQVEVSVTYIKESKEWQGASVVVWYHSEDQRQYDDFYTRPSA